MLNEFDPTEEEKNLRKDDYSQDDKILLNSVKSIEVRISRKFHAKPNTTLARKIFNKKQIKKVKPKAYQFNGRSCSTVSASSSLMLFN
jgi:hypothetical protein